MKIKAKASEKIAPFALILALLAAWQALCALGLVPAYMLPSPAGVCGAFFRDFPLLMAHLKTTLAESFAGLAFSIALAFAFAAVMDSFALVYKAVYPLLVVSQTVPTVAIAPLLILWFGYGMSSKVILIVVSCFFPLVVSMLTGFSACDEDGIKLLKSFGASKCQIFWLVKFPSSLPHFFSGLKIAVSYSIVGAVISEWLGGTSGLGVYMIRVKKSYSFDKMFAVIFLTSALSLALMKIVSALEKRICKNEEKP